MLTITLLREKDRADELGAALAEDGSWWNKHLVATEATRLQPGDWELVFVRNFGLYCSRKAVSWQSGLMLQVKEQITKLAKKGSTPSQIGVVLRDSHGIAQVRALSLSI